MKDTIKGGLSMVSSLRKEHIVEGDVTLIHTSVESLMWAISDHFHKPNEIDARRRTRFLEEDVPNAPR
jgi:hypothetical protein